MSGFDFDAHPLTNGQQYFGDPDTQGRFMVGLGRARRNNWGEWRQEDVTAFLGQAHRLLITGDPAIKGLLADLAGLLEASKPRWADLNALLAQVTAGDATAQAAAAEVMAMVQGGKDVDAAIAEANTKYAQGIPETPKPNAPKAAAAKAR